jgi:predicted branched-subunit amino acid permease
MINSKIFLKGLFSIKSFDSPGIALAASFIAIGALLKNIGFTLEESIFSSFLIYALPGSLVLAESTIIGASLLNIFLAVWLVNARLYPMTVSLMPLIHSKGQPKWKYYLSCHFVAVSSWLILKSNYKKIYKEYRIDFWIGIGTATWLIGIFATLIGYISADYLNKDMMIGLAIVNPIYFMCAMLGVMKSKSILFAIIFGAILGPLFYLISQEWCILFGGFTAGTIAFLIGEKNVS